MKNGPEHALQDMWNDFLERNKFKYLIKVPEHIDFFENIKFIYIHKTYHLFKKNDRILNNPVPLYYLLFEYNGIAKNIVMHNAESGIYEALEGRLETQSWDTDEVTLENLYIEAGAKFEDVLMDDVLDSEIISEILYEDFQLGDKVISLFEKEKVKCLD